jgi:hypothetical protein
MLLAVFYSSVATVLYTHVEKLLAAKHFTVIAICSSAYIPLIAHLLPHAL